MRIDIRGLKGFRGLKGATAFLTSKTIFNAKAFLILSTLFAPFASCSNDMKDIQRFQRETPPDQEVKDAHVWRSQEGKLQIELDAPTIVQYRQPDTRTEYPDGVELRFYDEDRHIKTQIRASKAISYDDKMNILLIF